VAEPLHRLAVRAGLDPRGSGPRERRLLRDRLAGAFVAVLAAFALLDASGAGRLEPGAILAMGVGVAGLVIVLRTRVR
jgi:hypothetical protein